MSRIVNLFTEAMNTKFYLPDYIIFMLDNDLIDYLQYSKFKVASLYGPWIEYLTELVAEAVQNHRSCLSRKARTTEITQIYWVEPVNHLSFDYVSQQLREKFAQCLELGCKVINNMCILKLREFLDKSDDNLVYNNSITKAGLHAYWRSIDASLEFNIKKRLEFLIRLKFKGLKTRTEETKFSGRKFTNKSKMTVQEDEQEDTDDEMLQFFKCRNNNASLPKRLGNRFLLPRLKSKTSFSNEL